MSDHRAAHWADIAEAGTGLGLWLLYALYRVAGRLPFRIAVYPVITYYFLTRRLARAASLQYLARLAGYSDGATPAPTWHNGLRHLLAFADTILDKLLAMSGRFRFEGVQVHGREALLAALAGGRGALLVTAHMGNLELCRAIGESREALRLTVLVHTRHAARFNRMLARLNPQAPVRLLQVTEISPGTVTLLADCIARGELVVIAGDRIPVSAEPRVAGADFLGQPAPFPVGPWVLASLLQCPVFLMFCTRRAEGYRIDFEAFRERVELPRARREAALGELVQAYAERLAAHCVAAPFEWFNFYPFWDFPART